MKQTNKRFNLLISLTLLVLAVVCVCNVTFAYFSSTSQSSGDIEFPGLDATFVYQEASGGEYKTATTASLNLYSADGTISRGVPFKLSLSAGGSAIHSFGIQNSTSSCDAYVRFWIDAYPLDQNKQPITTVNYGKYFILANSAYYTNTNSSVSGSTCYFGIGILYPNDPSEPTALSLGNTLTLQDFSANDVFPVELLGESFQISISFEVVQAANKAYLAAFGEYGDTKGYYKSWS